jgi:rubrerythrin
MSENIKRNEELSRKIDADVVLDCMANNEKLLSVLYEKYAVSFPEQADFWKELAFEEKLHFGWISSLKRQMEEKGIYVDIDRFKKEAVMSFQDHVKSCISQMDDKDNTMNIVQALSTSLDIEQGMLERNFFEVFESDSVEVRHTLDNLRINTEEHAGKVRRIWEQRKLTGSGGMDSASVFKNDGGSW